MARSATEGLLIPEQIWDVGSAYGFTQGYATDSANPLSWAMGQYVRLAQSISSGTNSDTPLVVCQRYATCPGGAGPATQTFQVTVPASTDGSGRSVYLAGNLSVLGTGQADWAANGVLATRVDATHWTVSVTGSPSAALQYKITLGDWNYVERTGGCVDIANRTITLPGAGGSSSVAITVSGWRNVSHCGP
jgi:glucoamylase